MTQSQNVGKNTRKMVVYGQSQASISIKQKN